MTRRYASSSTVRTGILGWWIYTSPSRRSGSRSAAVLAVVAVVVAAGCSYESRSRGNACGDLEERLDRAAECLPAGAELIETEERVEQTQIFLGRDDLVVERTYEVALGRDEAFAALQQALRADEMVFTIQDPWDRHGNKQVLLEDGDNVVSFVVHDHDIVLSSWTEL